MSDSSGMKDQGQLMAVLDRIAAALVLVEVGTGRLVLANEAAAGFSFAYAGSTPQDIHVTSMDGEQLADNDLPRARAGRGEKFKSVLVNWHTPDGIVSLLVHCDILPGSGEEPSIAVVTFQDVTVLLQSEAQLRRTLDSRDEFLSVATHELRSPIASVRLMLERIYRTVKKGGAWSAEEIERQLERTLRQVDRLTLHVQNLLDLSRIRHELFELELERFDLRYLVDEVSASLSEQVRAGGSQLSVHVNGSIEGLWDRMRIEQIVYNLVTNAIKYGEKKPIELSLDRQDRAAILRVRDSGGGIPEADQARIFEPFERGTSAHKGQSLGLGLYIVREIAKAHGGVVRVVSTPGQGAVFTVELPIVMESHVSKEEE